MRLVIGPSSAEWSGTDLKVGDTVEISCEAIVRSLSTTQTLAVPSGSDQFEVTEDQHASLEIQVESVQVGFQPS